MTINDQSVQGVSMPPTKQQINNRFVFLPCTKMYCTFHNYFYFFIAESEDELDLSSVKRSTGRNVSNPMKQKVCALNDRFVFSKMTQISA